MSFKVHFPLGALLALASITSAQTSVTINSANSLGAFMVVNELPANGGAFVFADNWGPATASGNYTDADTIVLGPENNAYDTSGDLTFWRAGGVGPLGNKQMTTSVFVTEARLVGDDLSFDFTVDSITFTEHTTFAYMRVFNANFDVLHEVTQPLTATGTYHLYLTAAQTGVATAATVQYGFTTVGINSSAARAPSYGTMVISAAEPASGDPTWAGFPATDPAFVDTGAWLGVVNTTYAPWIYIWNLGGWAFLPEEYVSESGAWTYFPNF